MLWLSSVLTLLPGHAIANASSTQSYQHFFEVRHALLEQFGLAERRIWVFTPYFTDGDLASALFVAGYRKMDVQVHLGRQKAHLPMSRLRFLGQSNIPTYLSQKPPHKPLQSLILIDSKLFVLDAPLDFLLKNTRFRFGRFHAMQGQPKESAKIRELQAYVSQKTPIKAGTRSLSSYELKRPEGRNERSARSSSRASAKSRSRLPRSSFQTDPKDWDPSTYTYSLDERHAPKGVPTTLPNKTVSEQEPSSSGDL